MSNTSTAHQVFAVIDNCSDTNEADAMQSLVSACGEVGLTEFDVKVSTRISGMIEARFRDGSELFNVWRNETGNAEVYEWIPCHPRPA